jgi:hypothetical protein
MWGQVAIANQTQGQAEQSNSAFLRDAARTLLIENSVSGVEVKTVDEGESSAAPVPSAEKWSHEAIVARSNIRPVRREKLNRAANSGENPGFDFLQECWSDDPAKADRDQEIAGEVVIFVSTVCQGYVRRIHIDQLNIRLVKILDKLHEVVAGAYQKAELSQPA